jgi:exodeoxyribonuclease VII small subunit
MKDTRQGRLDVPPDGDPDAEHDGVEAAGLDGAQAVSGPDESATAATGSDTVDDGAGGLPDGMSFEEAMQRLEEIVQGLEDGSLSLDASIQGFEQGMRLVRLCAAELERAERRVRQLTEEAGRLRLSDFEPEVE